MTGAAEFAELCPGCFTAKGNAGICAHCGYDESLKRGPLVLPHRALLHHGQYLIGKVLGKPGGFGITYLALNTKLETKVAIKEYLPRDLAGRDAGHATISAHSAEDGEFFRYGLTQFLQEARTLARFDHANIVRVRNFFEENGTGYLVMDYYDGITLADYLARQPQGRLPEKTAVGILMPILDGLREVHAKNFLHRDIKPQNIYLTTGNRAILLDFGAARQAMSERSRSLSVMLSEGYAPYEQYHRRGEQGPWTDIYACAAVLYHAVAGQAPPPATERMHKDELDIASLRVSASLAEALRLGLTADHRKRPQRMTEFQALLLGGSEPSGLNEGEQKLKKADLSAPATIVAPRPIEPIPRKSSPAQKVWWAAGLAVVIVIAMVAMGTREEKKKVPTVDAPVPVAPDAEMQPGKVFKDCLECPEMIVIPAGSFEMGSNSGDSNEKPVHTVRIDNPFALGKTEVTQRQWRAVVGSEPPELRFKGCDDCPVDNVSWTEAQEYIRKLSQKSGKSYRLPSEAEWEYACRAGGTHTYCGGENLDSVGWYGSNSDSKTRPVAGKQANAWGLFDMSGNIWEWTDDCWNKSYSGAPSDGSAWTSGDCKRRVTRGGSWISGPQGTRSAKRSGGNSSNRNYVTGFRVARTTAKVVPATEGTAADGQHAKRGSVTYEVEKYEDKVGNFNVTRLVATLDGKRLEGPSNTLLWIHAQKDFNGDGVMDALISDQGGTASADTQFVTISGGKIVTAFVENDPFGFEGTFKIVEEGGRFLAKAESANTTEFWGFDGQKAIKVRSMPHRKLETIAEIRLEGPYTDSEDKTLDSDLGLDGKPDRITCEIWSKGGVYTSCTLPLPGGKTQDVKQLWCRRVGVLKTRSNGYRELVCNNNAVIRFDGRAWVQLKPAP